MADSLTAFSVPTCMIFIGLASQGADSVACLFSTPNPPSCDSSVLESHSFFMFDTFSRYLLTIYGAPSFYSEDYVPKPLTLRL
ncbi:hypothetical protein BJV74DRAFT_842514 [Russula compacta]|nr:hypothetical protein BJV74DRAFT_842514 [Russula compacta]